MHRVGGLRRRASGPPTVSILSAGTPDAIAAHGQQWLHANVDHAHEAVVVCDGYVTIDGIKRDALLLDLQSYRDPAGRMKMAVLIMAKRYIDFISAYCDSWCERCAFTERCSNFAVQSALAMCDGNAEAAFELALGPSRVPGASAQKKLHERMADALGDFDPSEKELDEIGREMDDRERRVKRHGVAEASLDYAVAAHRWLTEHDRCARNIDPPVREAIETIGRDSHLIHVKIMRALDGRDEYQRGVPFEKSAVQSDWNGSAKVALISVQRSEHAWRVVAAATGDEAAAVLAVSLENLRQEMDKEFPRAMDFRRPGFDEPKRRSR